MSRAFLFLLLAIWYLGTEHAGAAYPPEPPLSLHSVRLSAEDRDALGRLAYAEAGNQGASGIVGVVFVVLNRVASGQFGSDIQAVIEAPGQFEPIARVGGTWRDLPPMTPAQRAAFGTILDLIVDGRVPDPTNGATLFQNPAIVAEREAAGAASPGQVDFGGTQPVATIRDHAFYRQPANRRAAGADTVARASHRQTLWLNIERSGNGIDTVRIAGHSPIIRTRVFRFGATGP